MKRSSFRVEEALGDSFKVQIGLVGVEIGSAAIFVLFVLLRRFE